MRRTRPQMLVLLLPLLLGFDVLRSKNRQVEEGNAQLKQGKAEEALARYDKAAAKLPNDPAVRFDRGAALSALGRHEDAALEFLRATEAKVPALKAAAFYNLGNSFFQAGKYGEAVEAYKRSLALAPSDLRAKWNLELALRKKQDEDEKKKNEPQDQKPDPQSQQDQKSDPNAPKPDGDERDGKGGDKGDQQPQNQSAQDRKQDPKQDPKQDGKGDERQARGDENKQGGQEDGPPKPDQPAPQSDPNAAGGGERPQGGEPHAADLREINAVLDSLERSPKALEQERARARAVRRRAPEKDW